LKSWLSDDTTFGVVEQTSFESLTLSAKSTTPNRVCFLDELKVRACRHIDGVLTERRPSERYTHTIYVLFFYLTDRKFHDCITQSFFPLAFAVKARK
jgi:hypothetical protein